MSASEKLRVLDGRKYRTVPIPDTEQSVVIHTDPLWDALPLIADVVEAAENYVRQDLPVVRAQSRMEIFQPTIFETLDAALTALREHLEGGDVT